MRKEKQMCMNMVTEWPLSLLSQALSITAATSGREAEMEEGSKGRH